MWVGEGARGVFIDLSASSADTAATGPHFCCQTQHLYTQCFGSILRPHVHVTCGLPAQGSREIFARQRAVLPSTRVESRRGAK